MKKLPRAESKPSREAEATEEFLPLPLKYRPKTWDEIVGNESTVASLKTILNRRTGIPHAFLLTGPSGAGKTTIARIIRRQFGCGDRDYVEFNSADYRGIDSIRDLASRVLFRPFLGKYRLWLLDECHQLTRDAQNALLKIIEEPPKHAYFILATTDPDKLLPTIRTRCQHFAVTSLQRPQTIRLCKDILQREGKSPEHFSIEVLRDIHRASQGSARAALTILDQILDMTDEDEIRETIKEAVAREANVLDLCRAIHKGNDWEYIANLLRNLDGEPESARRGILGYFNTILLETGDPLVADTMNMFTDSLIYNGMPGLTLACYMAWSLGKQNNT